MQLSDLKAVDQLEAAAYGVHQPQSNYKHDLQQNQLSHHFVLKLSAPKIIIGHAALWLLADEIHISSIAVNPDWQRLGLSEWLLLTLLDKGEQLGGVVATLEVRPSNQPALGLYEKYQFEEIGRRPHYYRDNDEDALILTTPAVNTPTYQDLLSQNRDTLKNRLIEIVDKINQFD